MSARFASPFDIPALMEMLREYRDCTPLDFLGEVDDVPYIQLMLSEILHGKGVAVISENKGIATGMLIAAIHGSRWSPKHLLLTEMAYWVRPEYRGGTAAHRLLALYVQEGKRLKDSGRVRNFFISKMVNSPALHYEKAGFAKLEEFWVI